MVKEPVLTYKKGEGWVYETGELYCEAITRDGVKCRVYKRQPQEGDYWFRLNEYDTVRIIKNHCRACTVLQLKDNPWKTTNKNTNNYVIEFDE